MQSLFYSRIVTVCEGNCILETTRNLPLSKRGENSQANDDQYFAY